MYINLWHENLGGLLQVKESITMKQIFGFLVKEMFFPLSVYILQVIYFAFYWLIYGDFCQVHSSIEFKCWHNIKSWGLGFKTHCLLFNKSKQKSILFSRNWTVFEKLCLRHQLLLLRSFLYFFKYFLWSFINFLLLFCC